MKTFQKLVKLSDAQYYELQTNGFFNWCVNQRTNSTELQLMIVNKKLRAWYLREFKRVEREFLQLKGIKMINVSPSILMRIFLKELLKMEYYPKAIIYEIRRKNKQIIQNCANQKTFGNYTFNFN